MVRAIQVRLKDKTTDEFLVFYPPIERPRRVHGIYIHHYQMNEDGSLSIFRETHSATYAPSIDDFYDWAMVDVSSVGHYAAGQYTSVRETQLDPPEQQTSDPD